MAAGAIAAVLTYVYMKRKEVVLNGFPPVILRLAGAVLAAVGTYYLIVFAFVTLAKLAGAFADS